MMSDGVDFQTMQRRAAESRPEVFGGDALIICDNLVKIYKVGELEVVTLQGLDLLVETRRIHSDRGYIRIRQIDLAQHPWWIGCTNGGQCQGRRG